MIKSAEMCDTGRDPGKSSRVLASQLVIKWRDVGLMRLVSHCVEPASVSFP